MSEFPVSRANDTSQAVRTRVLHFGNNSSSPEMERVGAVAKTSQAFRIGDDYTAYVDDTHHNYSAILIFGSDTVRISKFMRIYRPLLKNKARIAMLVHSNPRQRTRLLNAGFDDVFDCRLPIEEAHVRIAAIAARLGRNGIDAASNRAFEQHLQHYVTRPLVGREARVLWVLVQAKGAPVGCERLAATGTSAQRQMSCKSLRVLISGLRSKLQPTVEIVREGSSSYALRKISKVCDLLAAAEARGRT